MPPTYSYVLLVVSAVVFSLLLVMTAGLDKLAGLPIYLLVLVSPFAVFSVAARIAKRNVIVRIAVVFGYLFLAIDIVTVLSVSRATDGLAVIGLALVAFVQMLFGLALLAGAAVAGRLGKERSSDGAA